MNWNGHNIPAPASLWDIKVFSDLAEVWFAVWAACPHGKAMEGIAKTRAMLVQSIPDKTRRLGAIERCSQGTNIARRSPDRATFRAMQTVETAA
jgi:hypothetical protein